MSTTSSVTSSSTTAISAGVELDRLLSSETMHEDRDVTDVTVTGSVVEAMTDVTVATVVESVIGSVVEAMTDVTAATVAGSVSEGEESKPSKPHKKKKKDKLDIVFDILQRTIGVLVRFTPQLLDVLSTYLSAGGDATDPKLRSLVSGSPEALAFLDAHATKSPV
jgi:hypothetical protein